MTPESLEERVARIAEALNNIGMGKFDQDAEIPVGDDVLGSAEKAVNNLMLDLQTLYMANEEKAAFLQAQQAEIEQKARTIEEQELLLETIEQQEAAIRELSVPIIEVEDGVIALPIIGFIDTKRSIEIMTQLLEHIVATQSKCAILDLTGVPLMDTKTAEHIRKLVSASHLLGAKCVVTGLSPAVAQTLVEMGVEMSDLKTFLSLKLGLRYCMAVIREDAL